MRKNNETMLVKHPVLVPESSPLEEIDELESQYAQVLGAKERETEHLDDMLENLRDLIGYWRVIDGLNYPARR